MMMTDLEMMMMIDGIDVVVGESKGDNYDEDVEDDTENAIYMYVYI